MTVADVQNAYLQAPSLEKHYVVCNDDLGIDNRRKVALIRHSMEEKWLDTTIWYTCVRA